jgi:hypothetical protein
MTIRSPKIKILVERDLVKTSFEKWVKLGLFQGL